VCYYLGIDWGNTWRASLGTLWEHKNPKETPPPPSLPSILFHLINVEKVRIFQVLCMIEILGFDMSRESKSVERTSACWRCSNKPKAKKWNQKEFSVMFRQLVKYLVKYFLFSSKEVGVQDLMRPYFE
jgi:hypothetical protein